VRLTVIGCTGSFAGPDSPASSYLVQADDAAGRTWSVLLDLGSGAFGALQGVIDPARLDAVCISHLHADHCADLAGLSVYAKYRPAGALAPIALYGPAGLADRSRWDPSAVPGADSGQAFELQVWRQGEPVSIGPLTIAPHRMAHPLECYGMRLAGPREAGRGASRADRATLAYTADTDEGVGVDTVAAGADLLLAEAAFQEGRDTVRGVHLTALRAGAVAERAGAARLILTHLPTWNDPAVALAEARQTYRGPVAIAAAGQQWTL